MTAAEALSEKDNKGLFAGEPHSGMEDCYG
jgi:hypothetical protein